MEEMIRDPQTLSNQTTTDTTAYPTWKLYDNPFYFSHSHPHHHLHHHLYLPSSARKIAACLWDLTFIRSIMNSELDIARAQIIELKAELQLERKARKKVETLNKKLNKQLLEERNRREAVETVCEKLANEIASDKLEVDRMKREMVEERKMLRMAEVIREERVQMKLTEAKILFEEKLSELESSKVMTPLKMEQKHNNEIKLGILTTTMGSCENSVSSNNNNVGFVGSSLSKRRASPEAENPHIKRGIKGFVEFPRVVRAISTRGRQLGSKVECQKAQLRLLLRQKSPFPTDHLIMG